MSNDVRAVRPHGLGERPDIAGVCPDSSRPRVRHKPAGDVGFAIGDQQHVMPARNELLDQKMNDTLDAAVETRGHRHAGIGRDQDSHETGL